MALSLNHVSIRSTDIEATRRFYVDVLGLQVGPRPAFPFPGYWLYQGPLSDSANAALHIIGIDRNDPVGLIDYMGERSLDSLHGSGAVDHIAFFATDLPDLMVRVQRQGIAVRERTVPGVGLHQVFLDDPSGIVVEMNYPESEKLAWDQLQAKAAVA